MKTGREYKTLRVGKKFLIAMLVCMLAVVAVAGTTVMVNNQTKKKAEIDLNETKDMQANEKVEKNTEKPTKEGAAEKTTTAQTASNEKNGTGGNSSASQDIVNSKPAGVTPGVEALAFGEDYNLYWPVDGPVILEFNMEHTIYFPTLNQYQCNPALILQSEEGKDVAAAADGIVTEIGSNEEIGSYVVMALGNDYFATYGQLQEISVAKGDSVKAGDVIAKTAKPTKYYTVEGDNLYFELTKDGKPVDPLDYVDYE